MNNHQYSEKSKCPKMIKPLDAKAQKGDAVYLKNDGGKHTLREKYVVLEADNESVKIAKLLHAMDRNVSTKISSKTSKVKQTDIFKCPSYKTNDYKLHEHIETEQIVEDVKEEPSDLKVPSSSWSVFPTSPSSDKVTNNQKHEWLPFPTAEEVCED